MRTFTCTCGNRLFFENSVCLQCQTPVGWCPTCSSLVPLTADAQGHLTCGNPQCGTHLFKCVNYTAEDICNWTVPVEPGAQQTPILCGSCRLTEVIPDLSIAGNKEMWYRLEKAKRRLLYELDYLGLPWGGPEKGVEPPLSFDFKADAIPVDGVWRLMTDERVYTGHQLGKITINIREADDAEREKLRVDLQEAHRTLNGHFRHEIGHYYWEMLVLGRCEAEFNELFGDHGSPTYAEALDVYYRNGPPADWQLSFVSPYASMHPWEDFAETFALYLDMIDILETAHHSELAAGIESSEAEAETLIDRYLALGIAANELNRSMGLVDLVPEVLSPPVRKKIEFVHGLIQNAQELLSKAPESAPVPAPALPVETPAPALAPPAVAT